MVIYNFLRPLKRAKILWVFLPILTLVVAFYLFSNRNSYKDIPQSLDNKVEDSSFTKAQKFFPLEFSSFSIRDTGVSSFKVVPVIDKEYKIVKSLPAAKINSNYVALYGPKGEKSGSWNKSKTVRVVYTEFMNDVELKQAENINDMLFANPADSLKQVDLALSGYKHWSAFREVGKNEQVKRFSGDARIILPGTLVMLKIDVGGGYNLDEFKKIVNDYLTTLHSQPQPVRVQDVMTKSQLEQIGIQS